MTTYINEVIPISNFIIAQKPIFGSSKTLELEARLGTFSSSGMEITEDGRGGFISKGGRFDSSIEKEDFGAVLCLLSESNYFEKVPVKETTDYVLGGVRYTFDGDECSAIKKSKLKTFNIIRDNNAMYAYDVRVSVSNETKVDPTKFAKKEVIKSAPFSREKKRYTFVRKNVKYELTEIYETTSGRRSGPKYEFEIEVIDSYIAGTSIDDTVNNLMYKIMEINILLKNPTPNPQHEPKGKLLIAVNAESSFA